MRGAIFLLILSLLFLSCENIFNSDEVEQNALAEKIDSLNQIGGDNSCVIENLTIDGSILSPRRKLTGFLDGVLIEVVYCSPSRAGREKIFGKNSSYVAKYGKRWRTGANELPLIYFADSIMIDGDTIPNGKYSIYTIPGKKEWDVIFNTDTLLFGSFYKHDQKKDKYKFKFEIQEEEKIDYENLIFENDCSSLFLCWDNVKVPIEIQALN